MPVINRLLAPLDAYPHWLVLGCAMFAAALAIIVLGRLVKWAFYLVLVVIALAMILLVVLLFLAPDTPA